jgi:hypothetical protein
VERPKAKDGLVAPFSAVSIPGEGNSFLYLNSASYGEYSEGSLVEMALDSSGKPTAQGWKATPLLGTKVAVNDSGSMVATAIVGTDAEIRIIMRSAPGEYSLLDTIPLAKTDSIGTLGWFQVGGSDYLTAEVTFISGVRRVYVWRVASSIEIVLTLPDDLDQFGEAKELSFSSPAFFGKEKLFVVFPDSSKSSLLEFGFLSAIDFLRKPLEANKLDLRKVSLLVIDAQAFFVNGNALSSSYALVPGIYRQDGFSGELSKDSGLDYRREFAGAFVPTGGKCDTDFANSFLVVDETGSSYPNGYGGIYEVSGWNQLKTLHGSAFAASNLNEKMVRGSVVFAPYSIIESSRDLGMSGSRIVGVTTQATTTVCRPLWLRMESREKVRGNGKSWVQWNAEVGASRWPRRKPLEDKGVGSFVVLGDYLVTLSYSYNKLRVLSIPEMLDDSESDKPD